MNIFSKESLYAVKKASEWGNVACSNYTTWYIDNNGDLYGCGYGEYGQQGNGSSGGIAGRVTAFTKRASNVAQVACSEETTWYITTSGDLYGCGQGEFGQQGNGSSGNSNIIKTFTKRASNVAQVACSEETTWYIDTNGDLYGCGRNNKGQQGDGTTANFVTTFTKRASNVASVACSQYTTWYLTTSGDLYGCGEGSKYQQGSGSTTDVKTFTKRVSSIASSVACSQNTTWYIDYNGNLYGCGAGGSGQQGRGSTDDVIRFAKRVSNVASFACSPNTTWYIDTNGDLYGCGEGGYGQQGNDSSGSGSNGDVSTFTNRASNVASIACSEYTTWYLTTSGDLYGCGYNNYGQQGISINTSIVKTFTKRN